MRRPDPFCGQAPERRRASQPSRTKDRLTRRYVHPRQLTRPSATAPAWPRSTGSAIDSKTRLLLSVRTSSRSPWQSGSHAKKARPSGIRAGGCSGRPWAKRTASFLQKQVGIDLIVLKQQRHGRRARRHSVIFGVEEPAVRLKDASDSPCRGTNRGTAANPEARSARIYAALWPSCSRRQPPLTQSPTVLGWAFF
jgi:hypothetical protein